MLHVNIVKKLKHFTLDVAFEVNNEIAVLFGPSGSGKTTILNIIAGLANMDRGEVVLQGKTLAKDGKSLLRVQERNIGYVFQDYALFPHKTVWENIAYGMKRAEFAEKLLEKFEMTHLKNQYPHAISGGEKQRTAFIRALATEPSLLLLDEPFSALDEQTRLKGYEQLNMIHNEWQIPIILVTHQREDIDYLADRLFQIEHGKIVKEEIKASS